MRAFLRVFALSIAAIAPAAELSPSTLLIPDMALNCRACDDFYQYANGAWLARAVMPAGKVRWGSYDEADIAIRADLLAIIRDGQEAARRNRTDDLATIGTYYSDCINEAQANDAGARPIEPELHRIAAISSREELKVEIRHLKLAVPDLLFWADVDTDPLQPSRQILHVNQGGLSLPDLPLYEAKNSEGSAARNQVKATAAAMLTSVGWNRPEAQADADRVIAFETKLSRITSSMEDSRDVPSNTHVMETAQANEMMSHWDWRAYLRSAGAAAPAGLNIRQPAFFRGLDQLLANEPLNNWKAYLRWQLVYAAAPWLSADLVAQRQAFDAKFNGARSVLPREQRCISALNSGLGPAIGHLYAQRHFSPEARRRGEEMVANLKLAVRHRIEHSSWMSPPTIKAALTKLALVNFYLGEPRAIPDYRTLRLASTSFWSDVVRVNEFNTRYYGGKLTRPTDPSQWYMLPQTPSGGADHARNSFQYPAAKFQPPFFNTRFDDALNYGALGVGMAHELTHLFDDRGRHYDGKGRLRDWWTAADAAAYEKRAHRLARQFDGIQMGGEHVNGKLTLSENIADLGGLSIAYDAMQIALRGKPRTLVEGFTPEQRFFLAWGRNFREVSTPERIHRQIAGDVHAPARARVLGPLADMPEFRRAFACRRGDKMVDSGDGDARVW